MHACLNAVANLPGKPGCVLIRALEPVVGLAAMARRRAVAADSPKLASGPGNLTRAMGITVGDNGSDLTRGRLTIEPPDAPREFTIARGPRVGITKAVELPLRYWIAGNRSVSCLSGDGGARRGRRAPRTTRD
jgi:DNA-3-methyladenine glycosylase